MWWRAGGEIQRAASRAASFLGANMKDATSLEPCDATSKNKTRRRCCCTSTMFRTPTRPPPECVVAKQNEFEHFLASMKKEAEDKAAITPPKPPRKHSPGSASGMLELAHTDFLDKLGELAAKKQYVTKQQWEGLSRMQPALASKMGGLDVDEQKAVLPSGFAGPRPPPRPSSRRARRATSRSRVDRRAHR